MLQTLDLLIAFAVIMTILSLIVTIIVQMVSAALALRGKNLANALALTFQTIRPDLAAKAHALAQFILSDPILSDSLAQAKDRTSAHPRVPSAASEKKSLSEAPWGWRTGVRSAWKLATAVRPGEVYRILHGLKAMPDADATSLGLETVKKAAVDLLDELTANSTDPIAGEASQKLKQLAGVAKEFESSQAAKTIVEAAMGELSQAVDRAVATSYDRFLRWFGTAQDRAEQWFQTHTRIVTIYASCALVALLQIDTIDMLRQLRMQPAMVQSLVASASSVGGKNGTPLAEQDLKDLRTQLEKAGYDLIPPSLYRWENEDRSRLPSHIAGMLITMGLLSLGAPFWFNLLKNMTGLRSAVAASIEKRPGSAPQQTPPDPTKG